MHVRELSCDIVGRQESDKIRYREQIVSNGKDRGTDDIEEHVEHSGSCRISGAADRSEDRRNAGTDIKSEYDEHCLLKRDELGSGS